MLELVELAVESILLLCYYPDQSGPPPEFIVCLAFLSWENIIAVLFSCCFSHEISSLLFCDGHLVCPFSLNPCIVIFDIFHFNHLLGVFKFFRSYLGLSLLSQVQKDNAKNCL